MAVDVYSMSGDDNKPPHENLGISKEEVLSNDFSSERVSQALLDTQAEIKRVLSGKESELTKRNQIALDSERALREALESAAAKTHYIKKYINKEPKPVNTKEELKQRQKQSALDVAKKDLQKAKEQHAKDHPNHNKVPPVHDNVLFFLLAVTFYLPDWQARKPVLEDYIPLEFEDKLNDFVAKLNVSPSDITRVNNMVNELSANGKIQRINLDGEEKWICTGSEEEQERTFRELGKAHDYLSDAVSQVKAEYERQEALHSPTHTPATPPVAPAV